MPCQKLLSPQVFGNSGFGPVFAEFFIVKKAVFRADPNKGGFVTSFITPVNIKRRPRFRPIDAMMMLALIVSLVMVMRLLVAR